jgi:hypothetical protein
MVFITGNIQALTDAIRWGMNSTDIMADWDVFYSTMDGYGFWGRGISCYEWPIVAVCDDEPLPF